MITEILERLFAGRGHATSRTKVKQRLKFILAHDRAAITPQMFEAMRQEIVQVISKYVELDEDCIDIALETDRRSTAVIANLPIRAIRDVPVEAPTTPVAPTAPMEFELNDTGGCAGN